MNDKDIMEGILLTTKGVCDLYMHGSIESATPNVHQTFNAALNDALCMQNNIYNEMAQHGWVPLGAGTAAADPADKAEVLKRAVNSGMKIPDGSLASVRDFIWCCITAFCHCRNRTR